MEGLIVEIVSNIYYVKSNDNIYECSVRGKLKNESIIPVVGDTVILGEKKDNTAVISNIKDRYNYLKRPKMANLTKIILVVSCKNPKPDLLLLDKQLVFANWLNIEPVIVLNKIDLDKKNSYQEIFEEYSNIGYKVILTDAKELVGIEKVKDELKNNICAFAGNSGVGKSTLINAIFGIEKSIEGAISEKNKRGKNTTTTIKLHQIDEKSFIADTPGFSTFDISEISYKDLYKYFVEINKYSDDCEYGDCTHIKEGQCNVKNAVDNNLISKRRYDNYCKIYQELKDKEEHKW